MHQIQTDTSAEGADDISLNEKLYDAANKAHEISLLMEAYYNQKNEARIGANLISAARTLMAGLYSKHTGGTQDEEKWNIHSLKDALETLEQQDRKLRFEAERIASEIAKLTWKITRNTRPSDNVRRELAGISKRIAELVGEQ